MNVIASETAASAGIIAVRNLVKQFGRFAALRGVNAEFDAGKFHVILGDNGAGKTTLLRALAGLAHPTRGTVSILGKNPQEACREIGYMAHPSLLYDEMSGLENLRYFARLYGIFGDDRCERVIRSVRLDPELARPVGQYSQGMRQRMSLARAILHDPKILLLDEPFSNVDVHSAHEMVALLKPCAMPAKLFSWSRIRRRCWRAWPTSLCGCNTGRSWTARLTLPRAQHERGSHEIVLVNHARDPDQGHPPGVAL